MERESENFRCICFSLKLILDISERGMIQLHEMYTKRKNKQLVLVGWINISHILRWMLFLNL